MENILVLQGVSKKFGQQQALSDVNLTIKKGDIYGLIGKNGAGKTTLIKIMTQLMHASNGTVSLFGSSNQAEWTQALKRVGSVIETPVAHNHLTAYENLSYYCKLRQIPNADKAIQETLNYVDLTNTGKKKFRDFSLGMKQRLGIALAIIKFPKLLILDEPTNGLDPAGIQEIRELIKSLPQKYDMTIIVSSHILSEIEQMATTVGIINHGQLLFEGHLSDLKEDEKYLFETSDDVTAKRILMFNGFNLDDDKKMIVNDNDKVNIATAIRLLVENDVDIYQVRMIRRSLEDVFLDMTGREGSVL